MKYPVTEEEMQTVLSAAQQIDSGVVHLELAYDLLQVLFDAAESEFVPVRPESVVEKAILDRFSMYFSAATIFQIAIKDALAELQGGRNSLYDGIRKEVTGRAEHPQGLESKGEQ